MQLHKGVVTKRVNVAKINILAVCMWPWGGIRTYLKYVYHYFPRDHFEITLVANPTLEKEHLEANMKTENIRIVWARPFLGKNFLFFWTAWMLLKRKYDVIHSHGYISAFHVSLVSWLFRVPHVFTIHGILVESHFQGMIGRIKRLAFKKSLRSVAAFHGVSKDILEYSMALFPGLTKTKARWVEISNGIIVEPFLDDSINAGELLRSRLRCQRDTFIFGFVGRFQPQKGFDYIIKAADILRKDMRGRRDFIVVAVGAGEYQNEYKEEIERRGLTGLFGFLPFQPSIENIMKGCDAILMPSIVEPWGLVAAEALCSGVPLIASDVPGLRQTIEGTPALRIRPKDSEDLAKAMSDCISNVGLKDKFVAFRAEAAKRFDARKSAEKLAGLFKEVIAGSVGTG